MKKNDRENAIRSQEKLLKIQGANDRPLYNLSSSRDYQVQILPDKSVSVGKFRPSKIQENTYYAHPQTIHAMRKQLFAAGDDFFDDLENLVNCPSCQKELDLQFWSTCPFCATELDNLETKM